MGFNLNSLAYWVSTGLFIDTDHEPHNGAHPIQVKWLVCADRSSIILPGYNSNCLATCLSRKGLKKIKHLFTACKKCASTPCREACHY